MRVKIFLATLAVIVIATLGAVALMGKNRTSQATHFVRESLPVTDFNRIEINGLAEVTLRQGSRQEVTVEGAALQAANIATEVHNGTLEITVIEHGHLTDWLRSGGHGATPHITVDLIKIDRIESAGAVKITASSLRTETLDLDFAGACSLRIDDLQATHLKLDGSGAIKADIAGTVDTQDIDLSGAGTYQASRLVSNRAKVEVSGAGKAFVNAKTFLKVDLSGAAIVEYLGDPKIEQDISGISKIVRRDAS
jgi:hypothetical protein